MLVLSRKPGEKVRLGSDIVLTVVEVQGHRVRLGIEAPAAVAIVRDELTARPGVARKLPPTEVVPR